MAQETRSQLDTYNTNNITTNNNEEIIGAIHNTINAKIIESMANVKDDATLFGLYDYSASRSYVIGQGVYYSSTLYRCTTNTTGVFNPAHWSLVTIAAKDEFTFTPATIGTEMTLISGFKYQRTHSLNTNTPKVRITRPSGKTFTDKDLDLTIIDVNTIQLDFGFEVDVGTSYVLIEK